MDEYMGIIKIFAGNFAPKGWAFCNGQTLAIASNTALFSLLGTTYGGDGRVTFQLPNLNGRMAIGTGLSSSGSNYDLGDVAGQENVLLNVNNLPSHSHIANLNVSNVNATDSQPTNNSSIASPGFVAGRDFTSTLGFANTTPNVALNTGAIQVGYTGNNTPVSVLSPCLALNYIICTEGIYPPRP